MASIDWTLNRFILTYLFTSEDMSSQFDFSECAFSKSFAEHVMTYSVMLLTTARSIGCWPCMRTWLRLISFIISHCCRYVASIVAVLWLLADLTIVIVIHTYIWLYIIILDCNLNFYLYINNNEIKLKQWIW